MIRSRRSARLAVLIVLPPALLAACASTPEPPPQPQVDEVVEYEEGVPGGVYVETVEVSARVVAIDRDERTVTLLGSDGQEFAVRLGPEVANFDQIDAGDLVSATVTQELVVALGDPDAPAYDAQGGGVALAPVGGKPGAIVAATRRITGIVSAIDPEAHTATLDFADGTSRTFPVRPDIDLTRHQVGEQVVFQVTETVAIDVRED